MPLKKGSSKKVISENIGEMVGKYKRTGTIGTSKPSSAKKAAAQAAAIAYEEAGKSKKPKMAAKGGEITPDGTFTAGTAEGSHSVSATAGDVTATAEVRIQKAGTGGGGTGGTSGGGGVVAGKQRIAWSGDVPPQKWTKFYSQVLAKFAVGSDLKIRVTFEATVDAAQAKAKLDEARVQLRELGLNDDALS